MSTGSVSSECNIINQSIIINYINLLYFNVMWNILIIFNQS